MGTSFRLQKQITRLFKWKTNYSMKGTCLSTGGHMTAHTGGREHMTAHTGGRGGGGHMTAHTGGREHMIAHTGGRGADLTSGVGACSL